MKFHIGILGIALVLAGLLSFINYTPKFQPVTKTPTILLVFNGEYVTEAENTLASMQKNTPELIPNLTICVSDDSSRNFAHKHNLRYFELSTIEETGSYLSVPMNIMGKRKTECILHLLSANEEVLYLDTDIVFFANPIKEFNTAYDLNIQNDECKPPYSHKYLCTGFMYIKPNKRTIGFFNQVIREVEKAEFKINDQNALDILVKRDFLLSKWNKFGMSINVLDVCKFPNGCRYFDHTDRYCRYQKPIIVHNNHIIGIKNKRERFEKYGLIFAQNE